MKDLVSNCETTWILRTSLFVKSVKAVVLVNS